MAPSYKEVSKKPQITENVEKSTLFLIILVNIILLADARHIFYFKKAWMTQNNQQKEIKGITGTLAP
jgi:hypothetical protein